MARLTDKQKLARVLEFLTGLGHAAVATQLAARGLSTSEADDGFRLLRAAVSAFHAEEGVSAPPHTLPLLDAWENRWLPIIRATLERRFPEIAKTVLLNIRQTRGLELMLTLPVLLDRLEALDGEAPASHRRARALLAQRGLTPAVLAEARALLAQNKAAAPHVPLPAATRASTLEALWSWYLEWSQTARATLSDRRLLKLLGFGQ